MGEIAIAPQKVVRTGGVATYTTDATLTLTDTFTVRNTGRMILHVDKVGAGNVSVVLQTLATLAGLAIDEITVTVLTATAQFIGPFPPSIFNSGSNDLKFTLTTTVTGLLIAALEI